MSTSVVQLLRAGREEAAKRSVADLLASDPARADHWRASGIVQAWQHDWEKARADFERALEFQSADASWWRDVGVALLGAGAPDQAITSLSRALTLANDALTHAYLGEAFELLSQPEEAVRCFEASIGIDRNLFAAHEGLLRGYACLGLDRRGLECARLLARRRKFDVTSLHLLADAQFQAAQIETSLRTYRRALRTDPTLAGTRSGFLFAAVHSPRESITSLRKLHEEWFRLHATPGREHKFRAPAAARRLRVGYFSIEYRVSPATYFLLPILEGHNREEFEIYGYHASRAVDETTKQYREATEHWRELGTADVPQALDMIRSDEIDILVDTSGHFAPKLLPLFQHRGAPIQAALPLYPATTGCAEIDYVLTDRWITPDAVHAKQYAERDVYRVPAGSVVFAPPREAPDVTPLPFLKNGFITFGLFQRPAKWNQELWNAVSRILELTPHSRLLLHHGTHDFDLARVPLPRERLLFTGRQDIREHLQTVACADIALDTFPYSGHTTTGDALWMGVPVVTMAGERHASRVSASLLWRLGLPDWVASSWEEYVQIAVERARSLPSLAALRERLRPHMAVSSVVNGKTVTRDIEAGYRIMWERRWNRSSTSAAPRRGSSQD